MHLKRSNYLENHFSLVSQINHGRCASQTDQNLQDRHPRLHAGRGTNGMGEGEVAGEEPGSHHRSGADEDQRRQDTRQGAEQNGREELVHQGVWS